MAYKKSAVGDEAADNFDVEKVSVGESSTDFGGKGAEGKAKAHLSANLHADRNMTQDGPLGGTEYGAKKRNAHMNNKG